MEELEFLGATIRQLRKARGLTLVGLADRMGIRSVSNLSRIERGEQSLHARTLTRILNALDISREEFFDFYRYVESQEREARELLGRRSSKENDPYPTSFSRRDRLIDEIRQVIERYGEEPER